MNIFNKSIILFGLILISQTTIYSQLKEIDIMKKFDVETFTKHKAGIRHQFETEEAFVLQVEGQYYFREQIENKKTPFGERIAYYKDTRTVLVYRRVFHGFPVGMTREYDREGNITKETNEDEPYLFSLDDLRAKIQREYKIDIFVKTLAVDVSRSTTILPQYRVVIPMEGYPSTEFGYPGKLLIIDADIETGFLRAESMPDGTLKKYKRPEQIKKEEERQSFLDWLFN
jgi:hypothetical protein